MPNGSFESPTVTDYQADPTDTAWSYSGTAGIATNGGSYNPSTSAGSQVAFIENGGLLSQIWTASAGTYTLSFSAAQRATGNDSHQQLRVSLRPSGSPIATKTFVWCGNQICEERGATGATVTKRFFAEGEQRVGGADAGNYYYTRDHLGSVREVTNSSGVLVAQYDYDVWGNEVLISGSAVDFGYTGHYLHQPSGLNLAMYRAYNPTLARWISRDPLEESGGLNLYAYVEDDPVGRLDLLGLDQIQVTKSGGEFDDSNWFWHLLKHDIGNRLSRRINDGVAVHINFENVCPPDHPVLVSGSATAVPAFVGHATTFPETNSARIDIHTTLYMGAHFNIPYLRFPYPAAAVGLHYVMLRATCETKKCPGG